MKYFQRLKEHPGVEVATFMSLITPLACATNKSLTIEQGLIVGLCLSAIPWAMVLISNIKK